MLWKFDAQRGCFSEQIPLEGGLSLGTGKVENMVVVVSVVEFGRTGGVVGGAGRGIGRRGGHASERPHGALRCATPQAEVASYWISGPKGRQYHAGPGPERRSNVGLVNVFAVQRSGNVVVVVVVGDEAAAKALDERAWNGGAGSTAWRLQLGG